MEISIKKLKEYVGVNGKYVKNHGNLFNVDRHNPEEDYVIVNGNYVIVVDKNAIQYDSTIKEVSVMKRMEEDAEQAHDVKYLETKYLENRKITVCIFGTEENEIWINATFFKEFINKAFNKEKGFAKGITFTGTDKKNPVMMWYDDELAGYFLPIYH